MPTGPSQNFLSRPRMLLSSGNFKNKVDWTFFYGSSIAVGRVWRGVSFISVSVRSPACAGLHFNHFRHFPRSAQGRAGKRFLDIPNGTVELHSLYCRVL